MSTTVITLDNEHRRKHFALFQNMAMPHFSLVSPIPVNRLMAFIGDNKLHFSGTIVFLISKVANEIREFKWRIRGDTIVEHDLVHPSYTVRTDASEVFSYCYVDFTPDYSAFIAAAQLAQTRMREQPSLEDVPDRDDYLFMSSIPWVHFTSMTHAMHIPTHDSVPRLTWGKIKTSYDEMLMPVGAQAHHGVVDGSHMGAFFERLTEYCASPEQAIQLK